MSTSVPSYAFSLRARARLHRSRLVRELAAGAAPDGTPERAVCAHLLTSLRRRHELARAVDRLVESSLTPSHPGPWRTGEVPVDTREVRAALPTLLELADRLRTCSQVTPRGVAMVEELLRDGAGPLYVHLHDGDVDDAARRALAALG